MSDETSPASDDAVDTALDEGAAEVGVQPTTPQLGMQSQLTRGSDLAARPGFRNPGNVRSKASKKTKKSRKGR